MHNAEDITFFKNCTITIIVLIAIIIIISIITSAYIGSTIQKINTVLNPVVRISQEVDDFFKDNKENLKSTYAGLKDVASQKLKELGPQLKEWAEDLINLAEKGIDLGIQTANQKIGELKTTLNSQTSSTRVL